MRVSRVPLLCSAVLAASLSTMAVAADATAVDPPLPVTIPNSEVLRLTSKLNGVEYELSVLLPADYKTSNTRYAVFYLLDGYYTFPMAAAAIGRMRSGLGNVLLVTEWGYGDAGRSSEAAMLQRQRDYVPAPRHVTDKWKEAAPGADAATFLRVLREEIIPLIDRTYRTDKTDRGIGGHSAGGLFTTYALFHAAETFQRFWISSPSLFWDDRVALQWEAEYATAHKDLRARVFADIGELEPEAAMREPFGVFARRILSRGYEHLQWTSLLVPDQPHATVPPSAVVPAMQYLYARRPSIQPDAAPLEQLTGRYQLPAGQILTLTTDGHRLLVDGLSDEFGDALGKLPLTCESVRVFYSRMYPAEISVPVDEPARPAKLLIRGASVKSPDDSAIARRIP